MSNESKINGLRRRVRAWGFFTICGLGVLWFGDYLEGRATGMGESIITVGLIWSLASFGLLVVNMIVLRIEKKKLEKGGQDS